MKEFTLEETRLIHNLNEFSEEVENEMREQRANLQTKWRRDDAYHYLIVNKEGTRFLSADRESDFYGAGSSYSQWRLHYGKIVWQFDRNRNPFEVRYEPAWKKGACFGKSANGVVIPKTVGKKAEVIELAKAIGIFDIV